MTIEETICPIKVQTQAGSDLPFIIKPYVCHCCSPEVFCKKGVLRNFAKFTGKHMC